MNKIKAPVLMLVTEPSNKLAWIVSQALEGGVTMVQWRQKTGVGVRFNRPYAAISAVVQDSVPLLVNTTWELAEKLHPGNIHLPGKSVTVAAARKLVGPRALIGKSVHTVEGAVQAQADGVDYLLAGTIFPSTSHPEQTPGGVGFITSLSVAITIPIIAIGGISIENAASCIAAGASGIAVLSAIMQAKDPAVAARGFRFAVENAWVQRHENHC